MYTGVVDDTNQGSEHIGRGFVLVDANVECLSDIVITDRHHAVLASLTFNCVSPGRNISRTSGESGGIRLCFVADI